MDKDFKAIPIKMTYNFDPGLLYLIQETTGKESLDILAFFSDLARAVAEQGRDKNKGGGISKVLEDFFPNTAIPFYMKIRGHESWDRHWNAGTREYIDKGSIYRCNVDVSFPEDSMHMSDTMAKSISEALIERELLGGNTKLEPFDRPETKTPKMYKKMMADICGHIERPKVAGYDPDIVGRCRNCKRYGPKSEHYNKAFKCECDKAV